MAEGEWRRVRKRCLLPRRVLMLLFRGKFLWRLRRAVEGGALVVPKALRRHQLLGLLNKLGRATWNVRIEVFGSRSIGLSR